MNEEEKILANRHQTYSVNRTYSELAIHVVSLTQHQKIVQTQKRKAQLAVTLKPKDKGLLQRLRDKRSKKSRVRLLRKNLVKTFQADLSEHAGGSVSERLSQIRSSVTGKKGKPSKKKGD